MNQMVRDMATLKLAQDILKRMEQGEFAEEYSMMKVRAKKVFEKLTKDIALN